MAELIGFDSSLGWILFNASVGRLSVYHERMVVYLAVDLDFDLKNFVATTMCLRLNLNIGSS